MNLSRFLHQAYRAIKLVICREDLPVNPRWREQGYPYEFCWDIDELFGAAREAGPGSHLWEEARRIYWEAMWRLWDRYKRGRPFFETYEITDATLRPVHNREWVLRNIVVSAMAHDIVPPEAKAQTYKIYREMFGPLATS